MTMLQPYFVPAVVALAVALRLVFSVCSTWIHARKARQMGCKEAPLYPGRDPFGISTLMEAVHADRAKTLPQLAEKRISLLSEEHNRYISTFRVHQVGRRNIFTVDPKNIQAMLATQFNDFSLGDMRRNVARPVLRGGIFTSDGEAWSHSRSLLRPQFTRMQMSNLDVEERHVQNAFRAMPTVDNRWTSGVDIQKIFFRLTIDSATEFLFGKSCDSQLAALDHNSEIMSDNFDRCTWYLAARLRFERLYWVMDNHEFRQSVGIVHQFVDRYVQEALERAQHEKKPRDIETPSSQYIFLDALAEETKDPIELRDESLSVLLAGRDTTAALLSWTVLLLARHPDIFTRLRNTVLEQFGTYNNPQNLSFASLKSCQYLQHFINETLRLYPVIPFNRRCAIRDTTLPRGGGPDGMSPVYLQKGQPVLFSPYVLHRRKDIWGSDADKFDPDRWASKRVTWEFVPFSGGPRTCIGQQFALIKTSYVLVRLLQRFDAIEDVHADQDIRFAVTLTSSPAESVTVRMHEAGI
ncbi:cytochrome P450 [Aspergillus avenaceus]|uniref:Cytochrome P450 n=1 Tax=Aspergillus avenaceus TaxID=36643 RepID=A0A5N6U6D4_ASPAV|nr:cytochrome P450 [Aspergillus avenaceus]